jgi:hypothetical protein
MSPTVQCYVRVSLNAATENTRARFHGSRVPLARIVANVERLVGILARLGSETPVGVTFLLAPTNHQEVLKCARMVRDAGARHFSVRRILGPTALRPQFSRAQNDEILRLFEEVRCLHSKEFRVAVPWRPVDETDLNPGADDFSAARCWQSTFKAVLEPDPGGVARTQLCGRYRGGGLGQRLALPALFSMATGGEWVLRWQRSFTDYPIARDRLLGVCVSCIDLGFIVMVDRLLKFVGDPRDDFRILHLNSPDPREVREC